MDETHLNYVMTGVLAHVVKQAKEDQFTLPNILVGDTNTSINSPHLVFLSPDSEDTIAMTSAWHTTICTGMIIVMETSKGKAYQLAKTIVKYIRQGKMAIPLVDSAGDIVGNKRLDDIAQRSMAGDSTSLFGVMISITWQEQDSYIVEVGTLLEDFSIDVKEKQ